MLMIRKCPLMVWSMLLLAASCGHKKETDQTAAEGVKVTVAEITKSSDQEVLTYSGSIEADNTVSIGFSVTGRINAVEAQEGQRVSKGQLLASIEPDTYLNNFEVASAGLEQVQDNFDRLNQLYLKGACPNGTTSPLK